MSTNDFKLTFVGVGPQRTASSWLDSMMRLHKDVDLPQNVKETMFFDKHYNKGINYLTSHFTLDDNEKIQGEIAPTYFCNALACNRLKNHSPHAKIFINIRNPIDKAYSLFRHHFSKGRVSYDFDKAIKKYPEIIESGYYKKYSEMWENNFGVDNVHYLIQDDVIQKPQEVLNNVCDYLKISKLKYSNEFNNVVGPATTPRFRLLALVFSSAATLLRTYRFHKLVNLGKKLKLNSAFSGGNRKLQITDEQKSKMHKVFKKDIEWCELKFNRELKTRI